MTDGLNLFTEDLTVRNPEAIDLCRETHIQTPVIDIVETCYGIVYLFLVGLIPRLFHLFEIHTVDKVERRRYIQIIEERKVSLDGDGMLHTVRPVLAQLRLQDHILLSLDLILEQSCIGH